MGVKGLAAWLKEQYPEAYTYVPRHQRYDHVYVDLPSVLHTVARKSACQNCLVSSTCTALHLKGSQLVPSSADSL